MASLPLKMLEPLRKLRGDRWPRDDRIAYQFSDGKSRLALDTSVRMQTRMPSAEREPRCRHWPRGPRNSIGPENGVFRNGVILTNAPTGVRYTNVGSLQFHHALRLAWCGSRPASLFDRHRTIAAQRAASGTRSCGATGN